MSVIPFTERRVRATVAEVHAAPFPDRVEREVWFVEPTDAAVVLGSTQSVTVLDHAAVERRGLGVVRRCSGGGAVVVEPGSATWLEVWLPADDERFEPDVSRSALWVGGLLASALDHFGVTGEVVAPGTGDRSGTPDWGPLVCFAGVAAGEVVVAGRKVVGVSQRRTRAGARFQIQVLHRFDAAATAGLFALGPGDEARLREWLEHRVGCVDVDRRAFETAIVTALVDT